MITDATHLLDLRQTRYTVPTLVVDRDQLTHQLLPASFRLLKEPHVSSPVWDCQGICIQLSNRTGAKTLKHVKYDVEHWFDLPYCQNTLEKTTIGSHENWWMPYRCFQTTQDGQHCSWKKPKRSASAQTRERDHMKDGSPGQCYSQVSWRSKCYILAISMMFKSNNDAFAEEIPFSCASTSHLRKQLRV